MRNLLIYCAVALFTLAASANDRAALLIVRSEGSFPPNEMVEDGKLVGVHIELVSAVAADLNIPVKFASYPWKRAIQMLERGEADAITYMGKTLEREKFGVFEEGNRLGSTQNGFFMLRDNPRPITYSGDLHQLERYTIGTIRARAYSPGFDQATYLKKDDGAEDEKQLLRKLMAQRFELAVGHVTRISYFSQQIGGDQFVFLKPLFPPIQNYLVFSKAKQHERLAQRFAQSMVSFKESVRFKELLKKYGVKPEHF